MKLRVIGWTHYDSYGFCEGENTWAVRAAVVDEIKSKGYSFTGQDHQLMPNCAPVLNDGMMRTFSLRGFADIMAEAHGYTGVTDYAMFMSRGDDSEPKMPEDEIYPGQVKPETDLQETFTEAVEKTVFDTAESALKVKFDDLERLRYIDKDDTLVLTCGEQTAKYKVINVDRKPDVDEVKIYMLTTNSIMGRGKKREKAKKELESIKISLIIDLKK